MKKQLFINIIIIILVILKHSDYKQIFRPNSENELFEQSEVSNSKHSETFLS